MTQEATARYVLRIEPDVAFESVSDEVCTLLGQPRSWFLENPLEAAVALNLASVVPGASGRGTAGFTHHLDRRRRPDGSVLLHGIIATGQPRADEHLLGHSADVIFETEQDTTVRWISDSCEQVLGWSPQQLIGRRLGTLTHPDDIALAQAATDSVDAGQGAAFELRSLRPDGSYTWISLTGTTIRDESGQVVRRVGSIRDITDERLARLRLERSESFAHTVVDGAAIGMAVIDPGTGKYLRVNPAFCELLGRDRREIVDRNWLSFTHPDDAKGPGLPRTGSDNLRMRFVRPDEQVVVGDLRLAAVDPDSEVALVIAQVVEITETLRARDLLRASEQRYRLLAENASDLVFQCDHDLRFTWLSPSVSEVLGWRQRELIGTRLSDLVHPDDRQGLPVDMRGTTAYEARLRGRDGGYRFMAVTTRAMTDELGAAVGIAGSARDITEWARSRAELGALSLRLSATLNAMIDPLVVLQAIRDESGHITDFVHVDANDAAARHTHRSRDELLGVRMSELVPGQQRSGLFARYRAVIDTGVPMIDDGVPYADEMQDGRLRLFDIRGVKVGDALCLTFRDVTEREASATALAQSETRFRMLAENASDVVMEHGRTIRWVSGALTTALGWRPAQWVGHDLLEFIHPDDVQDLQSEVLAHFSRGETVWRRTHRFATSEGTYRYMSGLVRPIDPEDITSGAVISLRDVDDEVRAARDLAMSEALLRAAVSSAPIGVALVGLDNRITMANPQLCAIVQRQQAWLLEHTVADLLQPSEIAALGPVWEALRAGTRATFAGDVRLRRSDGSVAWTRCAAVRLPDDKGGQGHFLIHAEDITAEREARAALAYHAFHDSLTGLRNRAWIVDMLGQDLAEARAQGHQVGVLFIDLDNFKVINDSLGHTAGDEVITVVATRIQAVLDAGDRLGRFGGDEFVVVLPEVAGPTDVERVAERLDAAVREEVVIREHRTVPTVSIGIAISDPDSTADSLLRDTDAALFRAKAAGRGRWHFFDQRMHNEAIDRLTLEAEIRRAIEQRDFVVHYQPIVRLRDRRIVGYEALVRWQHRDRGLVSPKDFLPVAEESGLIVGLGHQIVDAVCQTAQTRNVPISMNVSAVQLAVRDWARILLDALARHRVKPEQIVVEVTETAVLAQPEQARAQLLMLRDLGAGVHVDDFGTGFSSISLLRDLPVSGLKLDRTFVANLTVEDSRANALAAGVQGLAEGLHLRGIAEGVETEEQCTILLSQGWRYGQGYLFGRPGPLPAPSP